MLLFVVNIFLSMARVEGKTNHHPFVVYHNMKCVVWITIKNIVGSTNYTTNTTKRFLLFISKYFPLNFVICTS